MSRNMCKTLISCHKKGVAWVESEHIVERLIMAKSLCSGILMCSVDDKVCHATASLTTDYIDN